MSFENTRPTDPGVDYGAAGWVAPAYDTSVLPGLLFADGTTNGAMYGNQKMAIGSSNTFFALVTPT